MDLLNVKYISEGVPRGGGQQIPKLYFGKKKQTFFCLQKLTNFFFRTTRFASSSHFKFS